MSATYKILSVGITDKVKELIKLELGETIFEDIKNEKDFEDLFSKNEHDYDVVACGQSIENLNTNEIAQGLRGLLPITKIYYFSEQRKNFNRNDFIKNGFDDAYINGVDGTIIHEAFEKIKAVKENKKVLKPVSLIDIEPNTTLDFNILIYFPKNKKHILFAKSGDLFEEERLQRLLKKDLGVIFVPQEELPAFYKHAAKKLTKYKDDKSLSNTERHEKMQETVRNIFLNIYADVTITDFEFSKSVIESCKSIVSEFLCPNAQENWYDHMLKSIGINKIDTYSHALNTSIFACLLAIGLDIQSPEDFAIAGLFHDIGLSGSSRDIQMTSEGELTPEESKIYETHPQRSLDFLKEKKIIISPLCQNLILLHHEALSHKKMTREVQLLIFANKFDKLTRYSLGKDRKGPLEAIEEIEKQLVVSLDFINEIRKLFLKQK